MAKRKSRFQRCVEAVGKSRSAADPSAVCGAMRKRGTLPHGNPRIPEGRMVPARIRHKGKTYAGKVKKVNGRVKIFVTPQVARKLNPERKWTIADIRAANRAADLHFFDAKTMKFFGTRIESSVYSGPGGIFFVTSEMYGHGPRTYKLRKFDPGTGHISSGEDFRDKETARIAARMKAR